MFNKVKFLWLVMIAIFMIGACAGHQKAADPKTPSKLGVAALPALHGVNLDGAEFGSAYPGTEGSDYIFPTTQEVDYFIGKGVNVYRIGFQWERMQPTAKGAFATTYFNKYSSLVRYATSKGAYVLMNPQNFARYYGNTVGSSACPNDVFADFWAKMANAFKDDSKIMFGLVNEPHDIDNNQWLSAANAAITSIRATGSTNIISVPGGSWTGAGSWLGYSGNSTTMKNVIDPANNFVYEMHHYFDDDASGAYNSNCTGSTVGTDQLKPVVSWLRSVGKKVFIAEIGVINTSTCKAAMTDYLTYLQNNQDVIAEWSVWSAGPWWGNNNLTLEPKGLGTNKVIDDPKLSFYTPFWTGVTPAPTTTPSPTPMPTPTPTVSPVPVSNFATSIDAYTKWTGGYCATIYIKNTTKSNIAWHSAVINMNGGSLRDYWDGKTSSKWGAKGNVTFTPNSYNQWLKSGSTVSFGFCSDNTDINKVAVINSIQ